MSEALSRGVTSEARGNPLDIVVVGMAYVLYCRLKLVATLLAGSYGKVVLHKEKDLAGLGTGDVVSRSYDLHKTYGGERETGDIYDDAVEPVLGVAREGHGYVIAYGQTGSGKTHTITGVTRSVVEEEGDNVVGFRYWEVGGRECYDTLDGGKKVAVRTDENGEDVVCGLKEWKVEGKEGLREIVGRAEGLRR